MDIIVVSFVSVTFAQLLTHLSSSLGGGGGGYDFEALDIDSPKPGSHPDVVYKMIYFLETRRYHMHQHNLKSALYIMSIFGSKGGSSRLKSALLSLW